MYKCDSYISFNICSNNNMLEPKVHISLTCLNWDFTYFLSIHIKQHFTNNHAFYIFIHKSYESNAHQHIIITSGIQSPHWANTFTQHIMSTIHTIAHKSSKHLSKNSLSREYPYLSNTFLITYNSTTRKHLQHEHL